MNVMLVHKATTVKGQALQNPQVLVTLATTVLLDKTSATHMSVIPATTALREVSWRPHVLLALIKMNMAQVSVKTVLQVH